MRAAVARFLQRAHSAICCLQVDTDDVYQPRAAFDPAWEAAVPFTMVLAPDGRVIFQRAGEADLLKLRRAILANLPDAGFAPTRGRTSDLQAPAGRPGSNGRRPQ